MNHNGDDNENDNENNNGDAVRPPDPVRRMTLLHESPEQNQVLGRNTTLPISFSNGEGLSLLISLQTIVHSKLEKESNIIDIRINKLLQDAIVYVTSVTSDSMFHPKVIDVDEYFELQLLICTLYGESFSSLLKDFFVVENETELYNYTTLREQEIDALYEQLEEHKKEQMKKRQEEIQQQRLIEIEEEKELEERARRNQDILLPISNKLNLLKSQDLKIRRLLEELDQSYNKEEFCKGNVSELTFPSFSLEEIQHILNSVRLTEKEKKIFLSVIKNREEQDK